MPPKSQSRDGSQPAFPLYRKRPIFYGTGDLNYWEHHDTPGMTLRDWFAGQAIQGVMLTQTTPQLIAEEAYLIADAMLKEAD